MVLVAPRKTFLCGKSDHAQTERVKRLTCPVPFVDFDATNRGGWPFERGDSVNLKYVKWGIPLFFLVVLHVGFFPARLLCDGLDNLALEKLQPPWSPYGKSTFVAVGDEKSLPRQTADRTSSPRGAEACFDSATGSRINQAAAAKRGGGLYFSWDWPADLADMYNLDMDLSILNDPSTNDVLFFSTQLSCGTTLLKNTFYFGIQTNVQGRGKGCLISRWGTRDESNCETAGTSDSPCRLVAGKKQSGGNS